MYAISVAIWPESKPALEAPKNHWYPLNLASLPDFDTRNMYMRESYLEANLDRGEIYTMLENISTT